MPPTVSTTTPERAPSGSGTGSSGSGTSGAGGAKSLNEYRKELGREATAMGEPPTKKTKQELPGTANEAAGDADTGNPIMAYSNIPRPFDRTTGYTFIYRKNHQFVSYGIAWRVSPVPGEIATGGFYGTTSLAEIPVDRVHLYLTKEEIDLMPKGARILNVKCSVVMRNPRTAFETASTTSSLATLNQNKFGVYGIGLNVNTRGVNRSYKFNATDPMTVDNVDTTLNYQKQHDVWYGTLDTDTHFTDTLPTSFMNLPSVLVHYYTMFHRTVKDTFKYTWQRLNKYIHKFDASHYIGDRIVYYEYSPKYGLLSEPIPHYGSYLISEKQSAFAVTDIGSNEGPSVTIYNHDNPTELNRVGTTHEYPFRIVTTQEETQMWTKLKGNRHIGLVDFGAYYHTVNDKSNTQAQPSLHVGVYPVHKMTTTENRIIPSKFTDVEALWDVAVECEVGFGLPNDMARAQKPNVTHDNATREFKFGAASLINNTSQSTWLNRYVMTTD